MFEKATATKPAALSREEILSRAEGAYLLLDVRGNFQPDS